MNMQFQAGNPGPLGSWCPWCKMEAGLGCLLHPTEKEMPKTYLDSTQRFHKQRLPRVRWWARARRTAA